MKHQMYHDIHISAPAHKLKKLAKGHSVQFAHHEIEHGPNHIKVHHETHKKLQAARRNKKGARVALTEHEIMHSGSLWDAIKSGAKWLGSQALNGIEAGASAAVPELAPVFSSIRGGVKNLTGLGVKQSTKGSTAMKERMAKVRAAKKTHKAGSFALY
jgi:hypothetical protein